MKSNKASSDEVTTETYCRHGFHEWINVSEDEASDHIDEALQKCRHCGKTRRPGQHSNP